MCCGGSTQKPSQVLASIEAKKSAIKVTPKPIPAGVNPEHFNIPKEIKEQLILQQQMARIKKTG